MIHIHCWLTHNIQADWSHVVARLATSDPTTLVLHFPPANLSTQGNVTHCVCHNDGVIRVRTGFPKCVSISILLTLVCIQPGGDPFDLFFWYSCVIGAMMRNVIHEPKSVLEPTYQNVVIRCSYVLSH